MSLSHLETGMMPHLEVEMMNLRVGVLQRPVAISTPNFTQFRAQIRTHWPNKVSMQGTCHYGTFWENRSHNKICQT